MNKHAPTYPRRRVPALHLAACAALMTASAACVSGDVDNEDDLVPSWAVELAGVDRSPVTIAGDQWNSCPTWDCGKNHAKLNMFPIPELHERGQPNPQGMRIVSVERHGEALDLAVENGVMTGFNAANTYTHQGMIDSIMTVTDGQITWEIMIVNYTRKLLYWAGPGTISAYHLMYRQLGMRATAWQEVCNEPLEPADAAMWPDQYETYALLIDDERYDTDAIKVDPNPGGGWFNIACAGSALSKMMLMHYNPHLPANDAYYSTPAERTAVLKMITADYLGIGEAFTRGGVELKWQDTTSLYPDPWPAPVLEGVWDEHGALCLDWPRLHIFETNMRDKIESQCSEPCTMPPTCGEAGINDDNWAEYGLWRTYNPWW